MVVQGSYRVLPPHSLPPSFCQLVLHEMIGGGWDKTLVHLGSISIHTNSWSLHGCFILCFYAETKKTVSTAVVLGKEVPQSSGLVALPVEPPQGLRARFLDFATSCPRLPPGGDAPATQTVGHGWMKLDENLTRMCTYIIVELRTPATPVGVGGGKERGGCHLNLRTWHAEGRRPILGLCWPILGLCWPILRLCWPMPSVVIYSILCCEMVRTRVNTTVLVPESG